MNPDKLNQENNTLPLEGSAKDIDSKPDETIDRPRFTRGQKIVAGLVGAAVAFGAGALAVGANSQPAEREPVPTEPAESPNAEQDDIPEEARFFVEEAYPGVYENPVATFYAEQAYINNNGGLGVIIGQDYITKYEKTEVPVGAVSELGLEFLLLDPNTEVTTESSIELFNRAAPSISRLMNLLAKNPSPEMQAIIIEEFSTYTGFKNDYAQSLVQKVQSVVNQYGSESNFSVNPAVKVGEETETSTVFFSDKPSIDNVDESGFVLSFNDTVDLSISVESFNEDGQSTLSLETLEKVQFSVSRAPSYDPFDAGFIGVGIK